MATMLHVLVLVSVWVVTVLWLPSSSGLNWQDNLRPKLFCAMTSRDYTAFIGNVTAEDHFTRLFYTDFTASQSDSTYASYHQSLSASPPPTLSSVTKADPTVDRGILLIGARNIVYKLSPSELRLTQTFHWPADETARETCVVKGKSRQKCQNFIVIIEQYSEDPTRFVMCGTNAFSPICKEVVDDRGGYAERDVFSGQGVAPFDPDHNSTATLVVDRGGDGQLYAGTVAEFTGVDSIIFRKPLRTQQYDSTQLNSPDFVGSFAHEDFVYFFFREAAVEYINCGKSVFSRVARVCKNDDGGSHRSKHSWTSFLKTRLNCSVPGEYPFYFDEIQGITQLVAGQYGPYKKKRKSKTSLEDTEYILYATFTTPANSIGGSAVCAFRLRDISDAFSGRFKEQRSMSSNWLPVEEHKVPSPRPGTCINDTKSLPDLNLNFIKTHSLMDEPVLPFFGAPVVIRTGLVSRFTVIAVDPQVQTTSGTTFDVVFVGTTNGRVIKAINADSTRTRDSVRTVIIEELQVFSPHTVIDDIKVMGGGTGLKSLGQLAVMSRTELRSFPVQRCDRASNCQECVALQDPYCAWEIRSSRCSSGDWTKNMGSGFLQSVEDGTHQKCPGGANVLEPVSQVFSYERQFSRLKLGQVVNIVDESLYDTSSMGGGHDDGVSKSDKNAGLGSGSSGVQMIDPSQQLFSLEMLVITVSAGAVAALVVGFVTGYCCGRRCRKDDDLVHIPYPDTEYEYFEQRGGLARPSTMTSTTNNSSMLMMMPGGGQAAPLLPTQATKLGDGRHEEVTYAEPDLMSGGLRQMPPSHQFPLVPTQVSGPGMGPGSGDGTAPPGLENQSSHYSSSLLNPNNKFNTISGKQPRPLPSINQYESAAEARLGSGKDPAFYARGRDNFNSYHMSTLGRAKDKESFMVMNNRDGTGSNSASNGSSSTDSSSGGKGHQVVDSAYGTTTRSAKKVYL